MIFVRVPFTPAERDSLLRLLMQSERICYTSEELLELATVIGLLSQKHGAPAHLVKTWRQVVAQLDKVIAISSYEDWQDAVGFRSLIIDAVERELATSRRATSYAQDS